MKKTVFSLILIVLLSALLCSCSYELKAEGFELLGEVDWEDAKDFSEGFAAVKKDGKWGFMKRSGEVYIEPQYEDARSFSNGAAAVKQNGKWGFINTDGEVVIDFMFDDAGYFEKGGSCPVIPEGQSGYSLIYWTVSH